MPVFLITSTDNAAGAFVFVSAISDPVDVLITVYIALSSFILPKIFVKPGLNGLKAATPLLKFVS